jgi:hypothetical protein
VEAGDIGVCEAVLLREGRRCKMMKDTREKFDISRMVSENSPQIRKLLTVISVIGIAGCMILLTPQVRGAIIALGEHILNRPFNTDYWPTRIFRLAIQGLFVFTALLIIAFRKVLRIKVKGGVLIFMYLIFQLFANIPSPDGIDAHALSSYLLSYRQGFSSRMFIGTIVDFLADGGFIAQQFIWTFIVSALVLYRIFLSVLLGFLVEHPDKKTRNFVILFVILYLSCFTSPSAYFVQGNFGRMELYALIFMLGIVTLIDKKGWRWLIPILCLFSIATHLVVIFFYMPLVFILLLYKTFESNKPGKNTMGLFIITVGVIILSSVYFVLFSKNTLLFTNEQAFSDYLRNKTDVSTPGTTLHYEFFLSMRETLEYAQNSIKAHKIFSGVFSIVLNIPVFLLFVYFWKQCIMNERRKPIKLIFILSVLMPIISIPAFMFFIDWGRWVIMIMVSQFILVFYFLYKQEPSVLRASESILAAAKKHSLALISFCILMIIIGPNWQIGPSPLFMAVLRIIWHYITP